VSVRLVLSSFIKGESYPLPLLSFFVRSAYDVLSTAAACVGDTIVVNVIGTLRSSMAINLRDIIWVNPAQ